MLLHGKGERHCRPVENPHQRKLDTTGHIGPVTRRMVGDSLDPWHRDRGLTGNVFQRYRQHRDALAAHGPSPKIVETT